MNTFDIRTLHRTHFVDRRLCGIVLLCEGEPDGSDASCRRAAEQAAAGRGNPPASWCEVSSSSESHTLQPLLIFIFSWFSNLESRGTAYPDRYVLAQNHRPQFAQFSQSDCGRAFLFSIVCGFMWILFCLWFRPSWQDAKEVHNVNKGKQSFRAGEGD